MVTYCILLACSVLRFWGEPTVVVAGAMPTTQVVSRLSTHDIGRAPLAFELTHPRRRLRGAARGARHGAGVYSCTRSHARSGTRVLVCVLETSVATARV